MQLKNVFYIHMAGAFVSLYLVLKLDEDMRLFSDLKIRQYFLISLSYESNPRSRNKFQIFCFVKFCLNSQNVVYFQTDPRLIRSSSQAQPPALPSRAPITPLSPLRSSELTQQLSIQSGFECLNLENT